MILGKTWKKLGACINCWVGSFLPKSYVANLKLISGIPLSVEISRGQPKWQDRMLQASKK